MKYFIVYLLVFILSEVNGQVVVINDFLYFKNSKNSTYFNTEGHIEIKMLKTEGKDFININDDRNVFYAYSLKQKITILETYLCFEGDISKSDKTFPFRGGIGNQKYDHMSLEIEALFSFSRMLLEGFPLLEPKLLYRETNGLVTKREDVAIIYSIYREWLNQLNKSGGLIASWPLEGTPYCWKGEPFDYQLYLRKIL